jgi:hypothetical protein
LITANIPSIDYIGHVLQVMKIDRLAEGCIVQLNFGKKIKDVMVSGRSFDRLPFDVYYLNSQGKFLREMSPLTEKVFVHGEGEGFISLKVDYQDETSELLNTVCSKSSYLVEQL